MTIYQRLLRWSCLSCGSHSKEMGGAELDKSWQSMPLKVLGSCGSLSVPFPAIPCVKALIRTP